MFSRLLLDQKHPECPVGFTMPETQPSLPEGFTKGAAGENIQEREYRCNQPGRNEHILKGNLCSSFWH